MKQKFKIRRGRQDDIVNLLRMVREMAQFLNMEHYLSVTEEKLRDLLFGPNASAHVLIAEVIDDKGALPIGYAVWYDTVSTYRGERGIYLEDIFVDQKYQSRNVGRMLMHALCKIHDGNGCSRIEWVAPAGNKRVNRFYQGIGAPEVKGWVLYRVTNFIDDLRSAEPSYGCEFELKDETAGKP